MRIRDRIISTKEKPFVIAEAGINHNGNLETAFRMIETAKDIGVDAVKFQTFKAEEFNIDETAVYTYYSQGEEITESMLQMFQRYEFSVEEWRSIKKKCDKEGILFLSTPQNYSDLELLLELEIPAIKVGSDDFVNIPLLKKYAEKQLPLILSCGMADFSEVYNALEAVNAFERDDIALLLCTSEYPTPEVDVNLRKLKTLHGAFPKLVLGFSDHTRTSLAAGMAVALGACIFEKHFTLNRDMQGPDHWFSENPESLKVWKETIHSAWNLMGSEIVRPTDEEKNMRLLSRRSIYVSSFIQKGEKILNENVGMFRPGNGLNAVDMEKVIGRVARRDLARGTKLDWSDIE